MKWNYKIWIISILFAHTTISQAQVTIGLESQPQKGALLDLKEQEATTAGGVTSEKGLLLPRVELQDLAKLQMGASSPDLTATGALEHTGLWVYNVTDKDDICPGVYVWDGALWKRLNDGCWTLNLDQVGPLYFASGLNGSVITPQSVLVSWNPTTATLNVTDVDTSFTTHPLATGQTGGSTSLSIEPDPMLQASVDANPFATKESKIKLEINQDGKTKSKFVTVNQTNKALIIETPYKQYSEGKTGETNKLTTNADFKVSYFPADATNAISNLKLDGTALTLPYTASGYERNDGTGKSGNLAYDVAVSTSKARYSFVVFSDAYNPQRFGDVTISVVQCSNTTNSLQPTIEEWAKIAGFTQAEIDAVKATGVDSRILPNGMQMHRQESSIRGDNQIFLSSNFGDNPQDSDQRWMIHNLDAIAFAPGVTYTGGDPTTQATGELTVATHQNSSLYTFCSWSWGLEGSTDSSKYNQNQRLGLSYTWDAATAGKAGPDGAFNMDNPAGTNASLNEGGFPEGIGIGMQKRRQGICPTGWHLPSDREWTDLENIMLYNTSSFSTSPNLYPNDGVMGLIGYNDFGFRGNLYGMKEVCQSDPQHGVIEFHGASNSITPTLRPGLDLFTPAQFWTSSDQVIASYYLSAYSRLAHYSGATGFERREQYESISKGNYLQVRCRKDN